MVGPSRLPFRKFSMNPADFSATPSPLRHRSWTGALADNLRALTGFACYGVLALAVIVACWIVAVPVRGERRKRLCQRVVHWGVAGWERIMEGIGVFHVDFPEIEALRSLRGTIIAPSHPSLIDAPHFLARMPRLTCLMKKSVLKNPFMGSSSRLAGYLPNDHGREFIRLGRDALRAGENLLIFPEGTRTVAVPVNPFKMGFALMATLAPAPIQTVFVEMSCPYLGKRWKPWRTPVFPVRITIRLGRKFEPGAGQDARELGEEVERYFRETMGAGGRVGLGEAEG